MIKKNRPISDFVWLNELDEAKEIVHGVTYYNQNAATVFLECISDTEKDHLSTLMENVKFFPLQWMAVQMIAQLNKRHCS